MQKGILVSNFSMKEPKIDTGHTTSLLLGLWQSFVKESCKKESLVNNVLIAFLGLYADIYKQRTLHFITLNYTTYYTLYHKLFKRTFCTLNYDICYTLYTDVKFGVNLNENSKFRV